jgi:putative hydroxymethylpyrimidine transport system substrate-binding protein
MKRSLTPAIALAVALLALALGLAACGEKSEDVSGERQPLSLTLDFYPNPDHAGIYMAQKLGYFEDAGLDVSVHTPADPAAPIKLLAAGQTDLAISYEPEVLLAQEQGLDVLAVGALVNRPLTSMIWLKKSGIKGIGALRGKTIATAGIPYQDAYLKTILGRADLSPSDVKAVNVGFGLLPAILGGRAQAMLGGFSNVEGVDLRLRGSDPVVTPVDKLGVPSYDELVLVARRKRLEEDPQEFRLFLAALARGTAAAANNPQATTKALLEANPDLDPKLTKAEVAATLPLLNPPLEGHPYGYMDPTAWAKFTGWMRDNGLISSLPPVGSVLSNAYLPGDEIPE